MAGFRCKPPWFSMYVRCAMPLAAAENAPARNRAGTYQPNIPAQGTGSIDNRVLVDSCSIV